MGDAGFEPGTSSAEVWCASNEPPHLLLITNRGVPVSTIQCNYLLRINGISSTLTEYQVSWLWRKILLRGKLNVKLVSDQTNAVH